MTGIDDHIPDATKMVTREEREELRRLRVEGRESLHKPEWNTGPFSKWLEAMDVASPRLLDTIDALETENARLRATMRHWEGEIGGATCDWGYCDRPTEDYRISPDTLTVLPVCAAHTAGAEAQRPVWDAIWRMTNLPFSDDDRRKIQQIALAFKEGGPRPGSWVAQYIAALTTAPAPEGGE